MYYWKAHKLKLLDARAPAAYHLRAYLDRLRERPLEAGATTEGSLGSFGTVPTPAERGFRPLGPIDRRQVERRVQRRGNGLRAARLLRGYVNLFRSE